MSRSPESEALTGKRTMVRPHTDGLASEQQQTVAVRVDLRPGARAAVRDDLLLTRMWPRTSYLAACASMSSSVKGESRVSQCLVKIRVVGTSHTEKALLILVVI